MGLHNFHDLSVWQKGMGLTLGIYQFSTRLPHFERFGLCSQMQRAAVSIVSNIAEGSGRLTHNEFRHFCGMAYGSAAELETQLLLANKIYNLTDSKTNALLEEVQKMLHSLITSLEK